MFKWLRMVALLTALSGCEGWVAPLSFELREALECAAAGMGTVVPEVVPIVVYLDDERAVLDLLGERYVNASGRGFYRMGVVYIARGLAPMEHWEVLVHEMVHHIQYVNGWYLSEWQAIEVQHAAKWCLVR